MQRTTLERLRVAATLCHGISGVSLRVNTPAGRPLLAVSRTPVADARTISPCAFRQAVADAAACFARGGRVAFCGLPDHLDPRVEFVAGEGTAVLPGGISRAETDEGVVYAFATVLGHHACHREVDQLERELARQLPLRLCFDVTTEVTVAMTVAPAHPCGLDRLDDLEALLARVTVAEAAAVLAEL